MKIDLDLYLSVSSVFIPVSLNRDRSAFNSFLSLASNILSSSHPFDDGRKGDATNSCMHAVRPSPTTSMTAEATTTTTAVAAETAAEATTATAAPQQATLAACDMSWDF